MDRMRRLAATMLLKEKLATVYGNAFEDFFHELMSSADDTYVPVRTAGRLGDMSADGLSLHRGRLYACYGPQVLSERDAPRKVLGDIEGAVRKRAGQFAEFVFVHNDLRGLHPLVSAVLADAAARFPEIRFANFGFTRFRDVLLALPEATIEDVLGTPLPAQPLVFAVDMEELAPLLERLRRERLHADPGAPVLPVSQMKMEHNSITGDARDVLNAGMKSYPIVEQYYQQDRRVPEEDEAAAGFRAEFARIRQRTENADELLWQLEQYILGNASPDYRSRRAAYAVLAYFFVKCYIFDDAPPAPGGEAAANMP